MGATGTATLNFGSFPGTSHATVDVVAAGVVATSLIEAWLLPIATAEHTADEHMAETLRVSAAYVSDGNFRVHGFNTNQIVTPPTAPSQKVGEMIKSQGDRGAPLSFERPVQPMIYGTWTIAWAWL